MKIVVFIIIFLINSALVAKETTILSHHGISIGDSQEQVLETVEGQFMEFNKCLLSNLSCPKLIDKKLYKVNDILFRRDILFYKGIVTEISLRGDINLKELNKNLYSDLDEFAKKFVSTFEKANKKYSNNLIDTKVKTSARKARPNSECKYMRPYRNEFIYINSDYTLNMWLYYNCDDDNVSNPNTIAKVAILLRLDLQSVLQLNNERNTIESEL